MYICDKPARLMKNLITRNLKIFTWRTNTLKRFLDCKCVNLRSNRSTLTEPGFSTGQTE